MSQSNPPDDTDPLHAAVPPTIEDVFEAIQKGNHSMDAGDSWEAATHFSQAQSQLETIQAVTGASSAMAKNTHADEEESPTQEALQMQRLYQQQARDYLHRARAQLIRALQAEDETDQEKCKEEAETEQTNRTHQSLTDEQALKRLELFGSLFAKSPSVLFIAPTAATSSPTQKQQTTGTTTTTTTQSLEDRLAALTASLPKSMQSTEQRMAAVQKGMGRLGVSVVSASENHNNSITHETPKSTEEQVAEIMAQAKDEVLLAGASAAQTETTDSAADVASGAIAPNGNKSSPSMAQQLVQAIMDHPDSDSVSSQDDLDDEEENEENDFDSQDDEDMDLTPATIRLLQDQVVEAVGHLAVLQSMLELDRDDESEVALNPGPGLKALQEARRALKKATRLWHAGGRGT